MQSLKPTILICSAAVLLFFSADPSFAQTQPDNSGVNKNQPVTADTQSSTNSDRVITRKIRRALIDDKSLSTYAHNVKIVTVNGAVTLKGPVHSEEEKAKVEADAASVVSPASITDQLTVKTQ